MEPLDLFFHVKKEIEQGRKRSKVTREFFQQMMSEQFYAEPWQELSC